MTSVAEEWLPLLDELDRWLAAGRIATLWWRDDDAVEPTDALERMLAIVGRYRVPLGLAVIPGKAANALAERLASADMVDVLQHGYVHANHALPGERAAEFGRQRPLETRLAEFDAGWRRLREFPRLTPIFVPPWNRYDADLAQGLASREVRAISAFGQARQLPSGIVECNCHVDIISWRTTRGFAGVAKTVNRLTEQLRARRSGVLRWQEATGILSHHLAHDEGCWQFLEALFATLAEHRAVGWLRPIEAVAAVEQP
jgi:predicted deacetylase